MEENIITSVQNARVKHVVALQQKSSLRREEGLFVVEGQREIDHCIACGYEIVEVFTVDSLQLTDDYLKLWVLLISRIVIAAVLYYGVMRISGAVILKECIAFILKKKPA